jgi:hypothetical protein
MDRQPYFKIFIGTNGVGKSFQAKKHTEIRLRNLILPANKLDPAWHGIKELKFERKVIIDPDDVKGKRQIFKHHASQMETFKGTRVLHVNQYDKHKKEFIDLVSREDSYTKGLLLIDDFKNYMSTKGTIPSYMRRIFNDRRHRKIDIILASHSLGDINGDFIQFNPEIRLFKCATPPSKSVLEKMANPQSLIDIWKHVNAENKKLEQQGKPPRYSQPFKLL